MLYEDAMMQLGFRSEVRGNLARLQLFFGNKTGSPFSDLTSHLYYTETTQPGGSSPLNLDLRPAPSSSVEPGAQLQQLLNVECLLDFRQAPLLITSFT